jgi:UPF0042 nucleotide-binding protein
MNVQVESFGYLHPHNLPLDAAHVLEADLQDRIHDPHINDDLRQRSGLEDVVYRHVLATPGADQVIAEVMAKALALHRKHGARTRILIGCKGGRHRSVVVAREVSHRLAAQGIKNDLTHHHVTRPVTRPVVRH